MPEKEKTYWGWRDIADLPEAIIFYGEMVSRGYHHHEIKRMLDEFFPKIDGATCKVIRFRAFKWLKSLATDIETKIYLAKSLVRLERICANEHEKTRNVLAADSQITHLLGLANIQEQDGPEELAAKMRAFLLGAQVATDGTAAKEEKIAAEAAEGQESSIDSGVKINNSVETEKAKAQIPIMPKISISKKELEDAEVINLLLRVARAKRLKKDINKLKEEGIKDADNKDDWDGEVDA